MNSLYLQGFSIFFGGGGGGGGEGGTLVDTHTSTWRLINYDLYH